VIVVDTSVVLAFMNRGDAHHARAVSWMEDVREDLVTTPLVIAELDHLVRRLGGRAAGDALRADLVGGAYQVEWWSDAVRESAGVLDRYGSLDLGLTDASLVALAARLGTIRVATLDERHFRVLKPLTGEPAFTLLPGDEER